MVLLKELKTLRKWLPIRKNKIYIINSNYCINYSFDRENNIVNGFLALKNYDFDALYDDFECKNN